jgi:V8-like Glu-specific endopeptidase
LLPLDYDGVVQILTDTRSASGTIDFRGTGALISDRHVLTAAHVLGVTDPVSVVVLQQIDVFASNNRVRFHVPGGDQYIPIAGVSLHSDYRHSFLTR